MKYKEARKLAPKEFKRLSAVDPQTFSRMVKIVQEYQKARKVSGRPSKLSTENQILMTLEYLREQANLFSYRKDLGN